MAEITDKVIVDDRSDEISNFLKTFESLGQGRDKMKYLCEFLEGKDELKEEILMNIPLTYKNYYMVLGPRRCWSFSYQMCKLESEYQKQLNNQSISSLDIRKLIYNSFKEGERYTKADLKAVVQKIYDHLGLQRTGKASDFEEWFEMKRCTIADPAMKKRVEGFELIKRKL